MQTFLPYPSFRDSAKVLDRQRLGKQRVECLQILKFLLEGGGGSYARHPAVLMWKGHESQLWAYGYDICTEWINRGYKDTCKGRLWDIYIKYRADHEVDMSCPPWLGNPLFHSSHRAALLAKDPQHYGQFGWTEEPKLDYWWPTQVRQSCHTTGAEHR